MRATFIAPVIWLSLAALGHAHLTLYHNLEVNLVDPATVSLYAIIHAPDLAGRTPEVFLRETYRLNLEVWPAFTHDPAGSEGLPEECTRYQAQVRNPGGSLTVDLDAKSEKRLMLVITRPAAFPQTRDIAPGTGFQFALPEPPPPPVPSKPESSPIGWILAVLAVVGVAFFALKRAKPGAS